VGSFLTDAFSQNDNLISLNTWAVMQPNAWELPSINTVPPGKSLSTSAAAVKQVAQQNHHAADLPNSVIAGTQNLRAAQLCHDLLHEGEVTEFRAIFQGQAPLANLPTSVNLYGTFDELSDRLCDLNAQGFGIFYLINQPSSARVASRKPARDRDIVQVHAVYLDLDSPSSDETWTNFGRLLELSHPPSLVVQTSQPHKLQALWLVKGELTPNTCREINKALAQQLGGDRQSTNVSRVFRLPGFFNTKYPVAVQVRIVHQDERGYSGAELLELAGVAGAGEEPVRKRGVIVSVRDRNVPSTDPHLSPKDRARLERMRLGHMKERSRYKKVSHGKALREPNPNLPFEIGERLRDCETLEQYVRTLTRVWPRTPGCRQYLALAASGELFKFGCREEAAIAIIEKVCGVARDQELTMRCQAVRDTFRRAREGQPITTTRAGSNMTTFDTTHWGCPLNELPAKVRSRERRRRVHTVLLDITEGEAGVRKCSTRTLAERTGVNKESVNKTLQEFVQDGIVERVARGVILKVNTLPEAGTEPQDVTEILCDNPTRGLSR